MKSSIVSFMCKYTPQADEYVVDYSLVVHFPMLNIKLLSINSFFQGKTNILRLIENCFQFN